MIVSRIMVSFHLSEAYVAAAMIAINGLSGVSQAATRSPDEPVAHIWRTLHLWRLSLAQLNQAHKAWRPQRRDASLRQI
jgi:hypothetical protein